MGLTGKFEWYKSLRLGGRKDISFILTCDNKFRSETFDCAIMAHQGMTQPMVFRQLTLKPKQSFGFNYDTVDWQWCDGDTFVLLGKNDRIIQSWPLKFQTYKPGECPECHGTHKCRNCHGKGYVDLSRHSVEKCDVCCGTGICQICDVPQRSANTASNNINISNSDTNEAKERRIASLKKSIQELDAKIEKAEWDARMMKLRNLDTSSFSVYSSQLNLIYKYQSLRIDLQSKLDQLERL